MKQFIGIPLLLFIFSCTRQEDASLNNTWQVESLLIDYESTVELAPNPIFFTFNDDFEFIINSENLNCISDFELFESGIKVNELDCDTCCSSDFEFNLIDKIPEISTYNINGNVMFMEGEEQLTIKLRAIE